jgi:hypothetical protein
MSQFFLEKNDREPYLSANLSTADGYVNLSGATAYFIYQKKNRLESPVTGLATIAGPASGYVTYSWSTTDTTGASVYYARWRVILSNGKQSSYPNDSLLEFSIGDTLG